MSCFMATLDGLWFKSIIFRLRIVDFIVKRLKIYCNNLNTVFLTKNNKSGS